MEQMNIIKEFWNNKADIMSYALQYEKDTIFLDSDVFIVNPINCIDHTKDLGLSPHYVRKSNTDEVGYYNGGCVWTKKKDVPLCWKKTYSKIALCRSSIIRRCSNRLQK